jgi:hypothetical protein
MRNKIRHGSVRFIWFAVIFIVGSAKCGVALGQGRTGGPTPSPEGAAVYFVGLKDYCSGKGKHPLRSA